jgi:hypothetical protein
VSKDTEWFGAFAQRQTENYMELQNGSRQHPEIGSVALRMLWIPVVGSILVVGYLALRTPQNEPAPVMAVATAKDLATPARSASSDDATARPLIATSGIAAESIAQHEALDPVGAGHEVAR